METFISLGTSGLKKKKKSESFSYLFYNTLCLTSPNDILMLLVCFDFFFRFSQVMICFKAGNKILCIALYLLFSLAVFSDLHKSREGEEYG